MPSVRKLILLVLFLSPGPACGTVLQYALTVDIDPVQKIISGKARLTSARDRQVILNTADVQRVDAEPATVVNRTGQALELRLRQGVPARVSFRVSAADLESAFMDADHVFLWGHWYPRPSSLATYRLRVRLPPGFTAVSEADAIRRVAGRSDVQYRFEFDHPVDGVHLAASNRFVVKRDYIGGIEIEACLFKEDIGLADIYLEHAAGYLHRFEKRLTPYPYRRLAIVANVVPTGISLPTFTLLGQDVLRLPFIVRTSLGHEIMHQWFGNAVYIDTAHGNWAEGLTTYLADHQAAVEAGRDRAYRKQILVRHAAYVSPANAIPVSAFQFRRNRAEGVIGYGRTAMFFHQLQNILGRKKFDAALRDFICENLFREASWHDLQRSFEAVAERSLQTLFDNGLKQTDLPAIDILESNMIYEQGRPTLHVELQPASIPYPLTVPISVYDGGQAVSDAVRITPDQPRLRIPLASLPGRIVLDEHYHVMRELSESETPAVLADILGAASLTAVIPEDRRSAYQPLLEGLDHESGPIVGPAGLDLDDFQTGHFLIGGSDLSISRQLIGKTDSPPAGIRLRVCKNPFDPAGRILLADITTRTEAEAVRRKLRHYGDYSHLAFTLGRNTLKETDAADDGIRLFSRPATRAVQPDQLASLDAILPDLIDKRVIYVGEQHDRFAHHVNQLRIIQYFHQNDLDFGVGMEMFKQPYQAVVDAYLAGEIGETAFLEKTRYFEEWGYDYNLYKPLVDYIKQNRIPLIALNLAASITRQVARSGIGSLNQPDRDQLPAFLDVSNRRYAADLKTVFNRHRGQEPLDNFPYFLQAQVLWDEAMAARAFEFLQGDFRKKIIVLAGNGHLRHRYGIPDRLKRRGGFADAVLLQDDSIERGIADYVLLPDPLKVVGAPKLGLALEPNAAGLAVKRVSPQSPARQAGLEPGDIITKFNHRPIQTLSDLRLGLYGTIRQNTYPIHVLRNNDHLELEVRLFDFSHFSVPKQ